MNYSVWVGGCEEHSQLSYQQALVLRDEYLEDGYDDVQIEEVKNVILGSV